MITIKFPKKPLTAQRKKGLSLAKEKFQIEEDDYYYIIKSENLLLLKEFIDFTCYWSKVVSSIDGREIDYYYLYNILQCITNKTPTSNLKWYGESRERDIGEVGNFLKEKSVHGYLIRQLTELGLIGELLEDGKTYTINKEKFKKRINESTIMIKSIYHSFENSKIFEIIDKFPDLIKVLDRNEFREKLRENDEDIEARQLELKKLSEEEITSQIVDFVKKEFSEYFESFDSNTIKYSLIPLFWDKKGISTHRFPSDLKFKIGKAETIAIFLLGEHIQKGLDNKESGGKLDGEEWVDWYNPMKWHIEVLNLLKKIEKNTRK